MRCILHIGTEKTGSTAIQEFLFRHRVELRSQGVHICVSAGEGNNRALPAAFMSNPKTDDFVSAMNHASASDRSEWKAQFLQAFLQEVSEAREKADVFIISSEHFHSRLFLQEEIAELQSFLTPLFDSITVVCYLRRQDQLALSRYSEALRAGHVPPAPLPVDMTGKKHRLFPYFDFLALLNRWSDIFGQANIQPRVYSRKDLVDGDIVNDFLRSAGIDFHHTVETKRDKSNIALSAVAQAILFGLNKQHRKQEIESTESLRARLVAYLQDNAPGKSRQPSASQAVEFYKNFEDSNNTIARRWFDRDVLFEADFSEYPVEPGEVSAEEVIAIMSGFLIQDTV